MVGLGCEFCVFTVWCGFVPLKGGLLTHLIGFPSIIILSLCKQSTDIRLVNPPSSLTRTFRKRSNLIVSAAKSFPVNETATFAEISTNIGLDEQNLTRLLRHAMTNRIFKELEPGVVAHTAISRLLAEDVMMNDWVGFCVDDLFPVWHPSSSFLCYSKITTPQNYCTLDALS